MHTFGIGGDVAALSGANQLSISNNPLTLDATATVSNLTALTDMNAFAVKVTLNF